MCEVSRALRNGHYDRAFTIVAIETGNRAVAAAFLLESGIDVDELPTGAKRAIADAQSEAA